MAPTERSFSVAFDALGLIERFPERYPGILESSAPSSAAHGVGRYDVLPIANGESLRLDAERRLSGPHAQGASGFLQALERWWRELERPRSEVATPFHGGWLLYLGYELAEEAEPSLALPASGDPVRALALRVPAAWVRDRTTGEAWLVAESGAEPLIERLLEDVKSMGPGGERRVPPLALEEEDPALFLNAVIRAQEHIAAGDVYQANLSRQWRARATARIEPTALYRRLRGANPSPFGALLRDGDFAVVSSSPERLLSIADGVISTRPIAGTRPRGLSPDRDRALITALLANEKERAEHVMLIDLERNDLGRVCRGGTVRVDEYMVVETYAHVHHIVSNVSGVLRAGLTPIDAIRALFPGGTITGCPKVRCMQIIAELEATGRGAYTGAIGYLNRDGSCDLNILIRTITVDGAPLAFRAGAGIVADSKPAQELAETRAKAEGLLRAIDARRPWPDRRVGAAPGS